jgi:DNA polymerase IV
MLADKQSFFNQLAALNDSSDEECETNEVRELIQKCKRPLTSAAPQPQSRSRTPANLKKIPAFQRAISAPASSVSNVKETPPLLRQQSLLREEISTPSTSFNASIITETPSAVPMSRRPHESRTVSAPSIGTDLVLNYSTGIESMLGKKVQKRKKSNDVTINLKPENERIFNGLTFYSIPPDDKSSVRKNRITRWRERGATWAGEDWDPERITHVIVEGKPTLGSVLKYLKLETWPSNITLVNENYPIDCIKSKALLDPNLFLYEVTGHAEPATQEQAAPDPASQASNLSLDIKPSTSKRKTGPIPPAETPPRSPRSPQNSPDRSQSALDTSQRLRLEHDVSHNGKGVVESPRETSRTENEPHKRQRFGDALDEMIEAAKGMAHLPLDDDDEDDETETSRPSSRDDPETSGSDDERPISRAALKDMKKQKAARSGGFNQDKFTCMKDNTGSSSASNPNGHTIEVLGEMREYYDRTRDRWRHLAYGKAINTLKGQTSRISTFEEAIVLPTIGDRLALKIEEIVATGCLRRLENSKLEANDIALSVFMKIYGVGINQAWKWVLQGHRSIDDLLQRVHLTPSQKLGIEKYDDLQTRIPRKEVSALGEIVKNAAAKLDPDVQVIIGGSYRRGAETSGDIDCLLTRPGTKASRDLLQFVNRLVSDLTATGFLVAALATPSEKGSASKWHGCCVLPGAEKPIWRRIDFLMVPATELGAALIYFTGDDIFNRSMRLLASRKGWRLNQRGLYEDVMRGPGRVKITEGTLMEGADEQKIFDRLGVPWRPPHHRICH